MQKRVNGGLVEALTVRQNDRNTVSDGTPNFEDRCLRLLVQVEVWAGVFNISNKCASGRVPTMARFAADTSSTGSLVHCGMAIAISILSALGDEAT